MRAAAAAEPTPWSAHLDATSGKVYYSNKVTGEVSWRVRAQPAAGAASPPGAPPPTGAALPAGWSAHTDAVSGKTYFANEAGEVTWLQPAAAGVAAPPRAAPPLPAGWSAHADPAGRAYFSNASTGAVSWRLPGANFGQE